MKKLLVALFLLLPGTAFAQVGPEVYKIATPSQFQGIDTSSQSITTAMLSQMARVVCTADCFIHFNISGDTTPVTVATGTFMPADVPMIFSVRPGMKMYVIGAAAGGNVYVQELTK